MTTNKLLVPVPTRRVGGLLHDTDCARGAESIEHAAHIDNECFDKTGHTRWGADYVMAEVAPFTASLKVTGVGLKPSYVWLVDPEGAQWPMFTSDYVELMKLASVSDGWIEPMQYEVCKKGTRAYGIRLRIGPK